MASESAYRLQQPGRGEPPRGVDRGPVPGRRTFFVRVLLWDLAIVLCVLHGWAILIGMGGREGLANGWPIWRNDHPLYYHSALATRAFLADTGTTAGYDPAFMSGYPKSVVFPASSTLPELVVSLAGGDHPELAYKAYVLASAAAVPWLMLLAAAWTGSGAGGACLAVGLYLIYVWTDFPINYASFGMLPYLLGVPLGLVATAAVAGYVDRGGFFRWLVAGLAASACVLVHLTTAMIVVPASAAMYLAGVVRDGRRGDRFPASRHVGVWLIPAIVLGLNAFWWVPGIPLASTKGYSGFAFDHHDEPVARRLAQIVTTEAPIECILLGLGLVGLVATLRRTPIAGVGLLAFAATGFFWGYLAAFFPGLSFLQPGRHTYALYTGMAVASGLGWSEACRRLRAGGRGGLDAWAALGIVLVGFRFYGAYLDERISARLGLPEAMLNRAFPDLRPVPSYKAGAEPFLSSRPSDRLLWVVERVKRHVRPGDRLLYEEAGFAVPGEPDPFDGGRFSGLLPERCGVEVIGGPYLHASLTTNFTQFGEGKLCERADWDRDWFVAHARLYRPSAIVCWSRKARAFCKDNSDLVEVLDDDGRVLIGRVAGSGGVTIRGEAGVEASPGRLVVREVKAGLDGLAVLRYHSVPSLRSVPEGAWEPVRIDGDPVPFIGVRPAAGPVELRMSFPRPFAGRWP